jgi:hypothetical protein
MKMTYEEDDIALDQISGGNRQDPAIADHAARRRHHGKK